MAECWDNPNRPNAVERAALLTRATAAIEAAATSIDTARRAVEPSGDRCALPRRANYDYQTALSAAATALTAARAAIDPVFAEVVPPRCRPNDPPNMHIGPWTETADARTCGECGAVYDMTGEATDG